MCASVTASRCRAPDERCHTDTGVAPSVDPVERACKAPIPNHSRHKEKSNLTSPTHRSPKPKALSSVYVTQEARQEACRPAPLMPEVALVLLPPQKDDLSSAQASRCFCFGRLGGRMKLWGCYFSGLGLQVRAWRYRFGLF